MQILSINLYAPSIATIAHCHGFVYFSLTKEKILLYCLFYTFYGPHYFTLLVLVGSANFFLIV